ncbi:hypothetical protein BJV78DRAFT_1154929 [Lactifluus subvellereus]|nr:hypothetical protein BJV78DRAFT_1154929 [Lactifluus subvellereus]
MRSKTPVWYQMRYPQHGMVSLSRLGIVRYPEPRVLAFLVSLWELSSFNSRNARTPQAPQGDQLMGYALSGNTKPTAACESVESLISLMAAGNSRDAATFRAQPTRCISFKEGPKTRTQAKAFSALSSKHAAVPDRLHFRVIARLLRTCVTHIIRVIPDCAHPVMDLAGFVMRQ